MWFCQEIKLYDVQYKVKRPMMQNTIKQQRDTSTGTNREESSLASISQEA